MLARSVMISLLISPALYTTCQGSLDSLSTFLESDARHDLVLFTIDGSDGNGDGRRDDTRLGRRVGNIGSDHESILGEELWHRDLVSDSSELGVDLHRHWMSAWPEGKGTGSLQLPRYWSIPLSEAALAPCIH
jgi:hypothetical protein